MPVSVTLPFTTDAAMPSDERFGSLLNFLSIAACIAEHYRTLLSRFTTLLDFTLPSRFRAFMSCSQAALFLRIGRSGRVYHEQRETTQRRRGLGAFDR